MNSYTITDIGKNQYGWNKGWNLNSYHTDILKILSKQDSSLSENEICDRYILVPGVNKKSSIVNAIIDLEGWGFINIGNKSKE